MWYLTSLLQHFLPQSGAPPCHPRSPPRISKQQWVPVNMSWNIGNIIFISGTYRSPILAYGNGQKIFTGLTNRPARWKVLKVGISWAKDKSNWLTKKVNLGRKMKWWRKSFEEESWLMKILYWWRKLIDRQSWLMRFLCIYQYRTYTLQNWSLLHVISPRASKYFLSPQKRLIHFLPPEQSSWSEQSTLSLKIKTFISFCRLWL